jgi:hypothetical protein
MYHIRPNKIFTLVDTPPAQRVIQVQLPPRRGAGGVTLLETCLLIAASQIVRGHRVFEFGTFLGSTTLNLALNIPDDGQVLTLDLDQCSVNEVEQHPADAPLTQTHLNTRSLDFVGSSVAHKITALEGNSITFDFSPWKDSIDLVFIDGGHDRATVESDTENALKMVAKKKESCILWHDYCRAEYDNLSTYLDMLPQRLQLFHIEDTALCVWFNDPNNVICPHFRQNS